jgi:sialate O-acetylesterase
MKQLILITFIFSVIACDSGQKAFLELPALISDGMVLQQKSNVALWGRTSPNANVEVFTSWGVRVESRADNTGNWKLKISTDTVGGPFELGIQTSDTSILIKDVLVGEVWLCSGQSNMEMPMQGWPPSDTLINSADEISKANFPDIHFFTVPRKTSAVGLEIIDARWEVCTPASVASFSATAYYFGTKIHKELDVPVGLIHSSWGGTPAESWVSMDYLNDFPHYKNIVDSFSIASQEIEVLTDWLKTLDSKTVPLSDANFWSSMDFTGYNEISPELDDSDWSAMPVPGGWENTVLPDFDGIVCLRTSFDVPASATGKTASLSLGPIDDMDAVFLNGIKIGETMEPGRWTEKRNYTLAENMLKEGKNQLTVFVADHMGGGGLYGSEKPVVEVSGGAIITLSDSWKYKPIALMMGSELYYFSEEKSFSDKPEVSLFINQNTPAALYNAMIHPLVPYSIKGAIWYQGESNVGRGFEYRSLFPALINSWRTAWDQGDFPFYYVQIAPYVYWDEILSPAAELREAQLRTMSHPNTGMIVTTDIGNPVNIHPADKKSVGDRLALWAFARDYGMDSITYSGPIYKSIEIEGNKVRVSFEHAENGLKSDGNTLTDFEVAGGDQMYYPASAQIEGLTVMVYSDKVNNPVAVRFGWSAIAEPNLFNTAGLPASPFRSDDWKRLSEQ